MKAKLSPKMAFIKAEMAPLQYTPLMDSYDGTSGFRSKLKHSGPRSSSYVPPYYPPADAVPPKNNRYITPEGYIMEGPEYSRLRFKR